MSTATFLDALSPLLFHPDPTADPSLDPTHIHSKPKSPVPPLSQLLEHTPLLRSALFMAGKFLAPFVILATSGLILYYSLRKFTVPSMIPCNNDTL